MLECLEKFIHPLRVDQPYLPKMQMLVHKLRVDTAYGFIENGLIPALAKAI